MTSLDSIRSNLATVPTRTIEPGDRVRSSVAILLRQGAEGLEMLLIERASNESDFWSGHIALPGGKLDSTDPGLRQAAERETKEELGIDLGGVEFLGQLRDIVPGGLPIVVSSFVYFMKTMPLFHPNVAEVADFFWFPLDDADDPKRSVNFSFTRHGRTRLFPAIKVHDDKKLPIWGMTYRLLKNLKQIAGDNYQ